MTSFFIWISLFSSLNKLSNIISVSNSELRIAVGCPLLRWLQGNNHSRLLDSFTRKIFMEHLVISSSVHLTAGFLQNISLGFSNTTFIKQKKLMHDWYNPTPPNEYSSHVTWIQFYWIGNVGLLCIEQLSNQPWAVRMDSLTPTS